jgi:apolipoprotein N-acyltransferase
MIPLTPLRRIRLLLALASGLTLAYGFAPHHAPLVAWLAMAILVFVSLDARLPIAFLCGFLHGFVYAGISVMWIYGVQRQHGGLQPYEAAALWLLMITAWGLFPGTFAVVVAWMSRRSVARACLLAPFLWVTLEFARRHLPDIAFPWNLLGYAVSDSLGLLQLTTLTGIYGLSFLVAGYGALSAWLLVERGKRAFGWWLALTAVLLPVTLLGGRLVPQDVPRLTARLVQTNLPQKGYGPDWQQRYAAELDELEQLSIAPGLATGAASASEQGGPDSGAAAEDNSGQRGSLAQPAIALIVWPEVPAPFYLQDQNFAARARRIAVQSRTPFLLGVVEWRPSRNGADGRLHPYNSAVLLGPPGERLFTYDKIHLVPFGEYVPWRSVLTIADKLTQEIGDFQRGTERKVAELPGSAAAAGNPRAGRKLAVIICFEAVFPDEVAQFVAGGAEVLVNISNDGWFGRSAAPDQHLAMARVRAVENRRWLLRATNNGYTVAIDPYGRIVAHMEADKRGALDVPFTFRSDRTLYSRFGDWLAWLSVAVSAGMLIRSWKSGRAGKAN